MKNNKSSYLDNIRNEMIEASLTEMMPVYQKLVNSVLKVDGTSFQYFPRLLKSLVGHYNHFLSVNATITVSTN